MKASLHRSRKSGQQTRSCVRSGWSRLMIRAQWLLCSSCCQWPGTRRSWSQQQHKTKVSLTVSKVTLHSESVFQNRATQTSCCAAPVEHESDGQVMWGGRKLKSNQKVKRNWRVGNGDNEGQAADVCWGRRVQTWQWHSCHSPKPHPH